jgi:hypothetical protein
VEPLVIGDRQTIRPWMKNPPSGDGEAHLDTAHFFGDLARLGQHARQRASKRFVLGWNRVEQSGRCLDCALARLALADHLKTHPIREIQRRVDSGVGTERLVTARRRSSWLRYGTSLMPVSTIRSTP